MSKLTGEVIHGFFFPYLNLLICQKCSLTVSGMKFLLLTLAVETDLSWLEHGFRIVEV
uniref:Uncharacterized protein n=1 Tax=Escherichia coli TaxID=562 RepID=A0A6G9I3J0_ECOLX|nr:hypothetical protein [Escherichia coli]QIQ17585.1 hypothetical protein [Escherichia coli]